jgi:hypothetical protein
MKKLIVCFLLQPAKLELCVVPRDENEEGWLGEAAMSSSNLRVAFSHDFPIGKLPWGHLVLCIPK